MKIYKLLKLSTGRCSATRIIGTFRKRNNNKSSANFQEPNVFFSYNNDGEKIGLKLTVYFFVFVCPITSA